MILPLTIEGHPYTITTFHDFVASCPLKSTPISLEIYEANDNAYTNSTIQDCKPVEKFPGSCEAVMYGVLRLLDKQVDETSRNYINGCSQA